MSSLTEWKTWPVLASITSEAYLAFVSVAEKARTTVMNPAKKSFNVLFVFIRPKTSHGSYVYSPCLKALEDKAFLVTSVSCSKRKVLFN